ncbi:MAG: hypothetical protein ACI9ZF_000639 [Bradyrhizobium sp.]|jgi:hypothetical protein
MLKFIAKWKFLPAALFALSFAGCAVVPYQSSGYAGTGSTYYQTPYGYNNNAYGNYTSSPYGSFGTSGIGIGLQYYGGGGRSHGYRGGHHNRSGAFHRGGRGGHTSGRGSRGGHRGR